MSELQDKKTIDMEKLYCKTQLSVDAHHGVTQIFIYTWYIFLYLGVGALYLLFLFLILFFFATHHPHVGVYLFVFYMGRRRGIGKWWRRAVGVRRSQVVNGLGELLPLFCVVILVYSFFFFNYTPMEVGPPVGMLVYSSGVNACC